MAATVFDLEVWIEGQDAPLLVRADQRDMAVFEREYKIGSTRALDEMSMIFFRFLGWSALRRTGQITVPPSEREAWLETVVSIDIADDESEDDADPGSPAAPEDSSSN